MDGDRFQDYKKTFVDGAREVLSHEQSEALSEAAFPAYANPNPLISFLFWQRVRKTMDHLVKLSPFKTALDFGCGGGVLLPFLATRAQRVVGYDIDLAPFEKILRHVDLPGTIEQLCRLLKRRGTIVVSGPTENLAYRFGRKVAGPVYSGDYHVRSIYDIRRVLEQFTRVQTLATLYYPVPLFKLYACTRRSNSPGAAYSTP